MFVDTWSEGPNGSASTRTYIAVAAAVVGDEMTVTINSFGDDYVNFALLVEVTAIDGLYSASSFGREVMRCQRFEWDDRYRNAMQACRSRLRKLTLEAVQLIRFIDKGDPGPVWRDAITSLVGGERAGDAAQAASVAAAISATHPELAARLRGLAAVVCEVPAALLAPMRVEVATSL